MKKKLLIILVAILVFMITPKVEAEEYELADFINYRCEYPSSEDLTFSYELLPGDIFTFNRSSMQCNQTSWYFNDAINVYINNKLYETEQRFTCKNEERNSCSYTILSYEEITGEKLPKGKSVKITSNVIHMSSSLHFNINIYYQYIDDVSKEIVYHNTFDGANDNPTTYYEGETDILLSDPIREGYKFLGWYTSPNFEEDTRVTMISKNEPDVLNLYAKWEKNEENITNPNTSSMFYIAMGIVFILILGTSLVIVYKYNMLGTGG